VSLERYSENGSDDFFGGYNVDTVFVVYKGGLKSSMSVFFSQKSYPLWSIVRISVLEPDFLL
jgi:hypothetical protein